MGVKDTSHADKPLSLDAKLAITCGQIKELHDRIYRYTAVLPVAVVMHPDFQPEFPYASVFGLPVIRSEAVPNDRPFIVWGYK